MVAALCVDELDVDAHAVPGALNASFEHEAHVEFAPYLFEIDRLVLVAEGSVSPITRIPLICEGRSSDFRSTK
jgi:hypothetical protein